MARIGRNDPCPCGSGKKFKKCHMGRESELALDTLDAFSDEMSGMITRLPEVDYGGSRKMADALDLQALTGHSVGIRFVDLKAYSDLNIFGGGARKGAASKEGGLFINIHKTRQTDPDHVYLAISPEVNASTLIHQMAHVLDYFGGSNLMPGTLGPLSHEFGVPVDHLEHTEEFGSWLVYLQERFDVKLDADDAIIAFLHEHGMLIRGGDVRGGNGFVLKSKSDNILKFLSEKNAEIDRLIRDLPGYIGPRQRPD
jgi:hypothetical protein